MLWGHAGAGIEERSLCLAARLKNYGLCPCWGNRLPLPQTVQTGLLVPPNLFLCGHMRCSTGSKLAGTWNWPMTSRAKVKNVCHYSSTPPHTFVTCTRASLHYLGYILDCISILSIHIRADKSEVFSKDCNSSFQIIAPIACPVMQHNRERPLITLLLPSEPRTFKALVLF